MRRVGPVSPAAVVGPAPGSGVGPAPLATTASPVKRVLQLHTRYRQAGGEDQAVAAERALLEAAGIEVRQVLFDNADLQESRSALGDLGLALSAVWSRAAARRVGEELASFRPQVMHVHNPFSAASPSVYSPDIRLGVPVVQSLHNYRMACPVATAYRDGHACTDCVGMPIPLPAVIHGCVRGSRAQSAVSVATLTAHRALGTYRRGIDRYLVGTAFQRDLMVRGGLPAGRMQVVPNFLEPDPGAGGDARDGVLYVGRLAEEKGIATLLDAAARLPGRFTVIGDGPMAPQVSAAAAAGHLAYLGPLWADPMRERLRSAAALVMSSIWFEGFPMIMLEAFAAGTPIIASRIGTLPDIVEDGVTGLLVPPGDAAALAGAAEWVLGHPDEARAIGRRARTLYEERLRGPVHLAQLLDAYGAAIARRARVG